MTDFKLPPKTVDEKVPSCYHVLAAAVDDETHKRAMKMCKDLGYTRSEIIRFAIGKVLEANGY